MRMNFGELATARRTHEKVNAMIATELNSLTTTEREALLEDVHGVDDWRQPRGAPKSWKSKVKWTLLQEYDVGSLEASEWGIPEADSEVASRLQQRALFNKHLAKHDDSGATATGGKAVE